MGECVERLEQFVGRNRVNNVIVTFIHLLLKIIIKTKDNMNS